MRNFTRTSTENEPIFWGDDSFRGKIFYLGIYAVIEMTEDFDFMAPFVLF